MTKKQKWLIGLLLLIFAVFQSLIYLDRELRGPLMFLAQIKIRQMATEAINTALTEEIAQQADADKMIHWKLDNSGKVAGFMIDYKEQMKLTSRTVATVQRVLKEQQEVHERIPIGHALQSPFLSSVGPSVAVSFHPASAVLAEVGTRETETGINMVQIEVYLRIRTDIAVVIPFDQDPQTLETEIPLSYAMLVGNVPMYYYDSKGQPVGGGVGQAPPVTLPPAPAVPQEAPKGH